MFFLGKLCKSWYIPHLESARPCLTPHQPHHHLSSCPLGSTTCLVAPVKTRTATAVINPHSGEERPTTAPASPYLQPTGPIVALASPAAPQRGQGTQLRSMEKLYTPGVDFNH